MRAFLKLDSVGDERTSDGRAFHSAGVAKKKLLSSAECSARVTSAGTARSVVSVADLSPGRALKYSERSLLKYAGARLFKHL